MNLSTLAIGIAVVFLELAAAYFTWKFAQNRPKIAFGLLLLTGASLRVLAASDGFLHQWDEVYHALVAKNLARNPFLPCLYPATPLPYDFTDWSSNHIWLHKPPLALWAMALSIKIFGTHFFAVRLPSVVVSVCSVFLVFKIAQRLSKPQAALLAALLCSLNGFVIELCAGRVATDHVDTMLLFWVLLGTLFALRDAQTGKNAYQNALGVGISAGLAVLTKWLPGFFVLFLYALALFLFDKTTPRKVLWTKMALACSVAVLVALPWNLYLYKTFPQEFFYEQGYNFTHLYKPLEGHEAPWWFFLDRARIHWNELVYLFFVLFLFQVYRNRQKTDIFVLAWATVPYVVFSFSATKMPGYVLMAAPAVFLLMANGIVGLTSAPIKRLALVLTLGLAIRYSLERIKPFAVPENISRRVEVPQLAAANGKTIVFACKNSIETMFLYEVIAYGHYPSAAEMGQLLDTGWEILVFEGAGMPDFVRSNERVRVLEQ